MNRIVEAIANTQDDELLCDALTDEALTLYAQTIIDGQTYLDASQRRIQHHLAHCPDCAQEVEDIVEMLRAVQTGELLPVQRAAVIPPWVTTLFEQGRVWVQDQLLWINFALEPTLPGLGTPAIVTKGEGDKNLLRQVRLGIEDTEDLDVDIRAVASGERCTIHVQVQMPSRWPDASGVEVTLVDGEESQTTRTNEQGHARFEDIAPERLDQIRFVFDPQPTS